MFPILENIPGIHATIVGVLAAFYSAYFMFAYQKVTEAKKKLEKVLNVSKDICTPYKSVTNGHSPLIDENGNLDWDEKCKNLIRDAKSIFSFLDTIKPGTDFQYSYNEEDQKKIMKLVDELTPFFSLFFTNYPMNGVSGVTTSQSVLKNINNTFDYERYSEIQRRISYLMGIWDTSQQSLINLFREYDEIQAQENQNQMQIHINRVNRDFEENPGADEESRQRILLQVQNTFDPLKQVKRLPLLIDFFQRVQTYKAQVMPTLEETINEFESYNDELKVKNTTKNVLYISAYIMVVGIIIPLILVEIISKIEKSNNFLFISYIEYFILLSSFAPYFIIGLFFLKKIENSVFK